MRRAFALCLLVASTGTACGPRGPRTRGELDAARLQHARSLHAETRAPELWQQLEAALSAARSAQADPTASAEYAASARLWLEASIAECERADLAAARLVEERQIEALYAVALRDQRAVRQRTEEAAHRAAADVARVEAQRSLELAATSPRPRPKLDRKVEGAAALALTERASLAIEAARAMGAAPASLTDAQTLREQAEAALATRPDLALGLSDRALSSALSALGSVRGRQPQPSDAEKQSLLDDLAALGAELGRGERGLTARLPDLFAAGDRLKAGADRRLERICSLGIAHPHGQVHMTVTGPRGEESARRRGVLESTLAWHGCTPQRFVVDARQADEKALELTWLAY